MAQSAVRVLHQAGERLNSRANRARHGFDRAAVEAVSTWRGRLAYQAGESVAIAALLPVRFRL